MDQRSREKARGSNKREELRAFRASVNPTVTKADGSRVTTTDQGLLDIGWRYVELHFSNFAPNVNRLEAALQARWWNAKDYKFLRTWKGRGMGGTHGATTSRLFRLSCSWLELCAQPGVSQAPETSKRPSTPFGSQVSTNTGHPQTKLKGPREWSRVCSTRWVSRSFAREV